MGSNYRINWVGLATLLLGAGALLGIGCHNTLVDLTEGPAPLRMPAPDRQGDDGSYEDRLTGGQVFSMYCGACHNARPLSERPFANYQNVAAHMRVRVNLTGKEYAKLEEFLRRWSDSGSPTPPVEPSPKRITFSQPINELREQKPAPGPIPVAPEEQESHGPSSP